ncbi:hypothetical protein GT354_27370, partial [Streptomyces sp. SID3343]|nr:hypothetical protein [Streptomyces sp. SID3343]
MTYWAIDAGGTTTTAALSDGSRMRRGSVNPASVGAAAGDTLADLFRAIARHVGDGPSTGWLATASVGVDTPSAEIDRFAAAAHAAGLTGSLVVSGDVPPLLLAPPLAGRGVVVVAGTGSAVVAGAGPDDGPPVVI